jgi:hypothetical protein
MRKAKKSKTGVNFVTRRGKKYIEARDPKGRLLISRAVKGSNIRNIQQARSLFKENGSFYPDRENKRVALTHVIEISSTAPKGTRLRRPKAKIVQFIVQGEFKGKHIVARSQRIGNPDSDKANDSRMARNEARTTFWKKVGAEAMGESDADEGQKFEGQVTNYREGYVYYVKNTRSN